MSMMMLVMPEVPPSVVMFIPIVIAIGNCPDSAGFLRRGDGNAGRGTQCAAQHGTVAAADGRTYCRTGAAAQGSTQHCIGGNLASDGLAYAPDQQGAKKQASKIFTHLIDLPFKQSAMQQQQLPCQKQKIIKYKWL